MQALSNRIRSGKRISFVPTMGFLHEGHLSLLRIARQAGDFAVASIFVNPTQFGPGEDFAAYPRSLQRDLALLEGEGVDAVFTPSEKELYPEGFETYVTLKRLPGHLCGLSRPVHFRGVATVVAKLFHIVKPHVAVFGEKDYQQLLVIKKMVKDLNMDVEIVGGPTVREPDGLAMSSRNSYLSAGQRKSALCLRRALLDAQKSVSDGERSAERLVSAARNRILSYPETDIDYISIFDPETLEEHRVIDGPVRMALAVRVGKTRLIDNDLLDPGR